MRALGELTTNRERAIGRALNASFWLLWVVGVLGALLLPSHADNKAGTRVPAGTASGQHLVYNAPALAWTLEAPQAANTFLAGPVSGGAALSTYRAVVSADVPPRSEVDEFNYTTAPASATGSNGVWAWTIPPGVIACHIYAVSGGNGGGSGRRGAASTSRGGGAGGNGGHVTNIDISVADLPSRALTLHVGAGGAGGAIVATDNTNGNNGAAGDNTFVTASTNIQIIYVSSPGGVGAAGTTNGGGTAGLSGDPSPQFFGGQGGTGDAGGGQASGAPAQPTGGAPPGGGGGGGVNASNVFSKGGGGGAVRNFYAHYSDAVNGGAPGTTEGQSATSPSTPYPWVLVGYSGSGGAGSSVGAGGNGGNGTARGGGGGGGGASVNGFPSGAGGNGGNGYIRITCYY